MDINSQLAKLNFFEKLAAEASSSKEIDRQLGASLIRAGLVDFCAIQAARLLEQIILKEHFLKTKEVKFTPHGDQYFFDEKIRTRKIFKEIKKFLPFRLPNGINNTLVEEINQFAADMLKHGLDFLARRDALIHHIGSPKKDTQDIIQLCATLNRIYASFVEAHGKFVNLATPYRFS